jgi:hypothetical protein
MVFNLVGCRWFFSIIEDKATAKIEKKISSRSYKEDQLVEIQIPLNMPYYSDKDYEEVYGETDWNGEHYRYVKRKISGNILYLLCLPDKENTSIAKVKSEFTKSVNDVPANKQGSQQKNTLIKLMTSEFQTNETSIEENIFSTAALSFINKNIDAKDLFISLTEAQPPELF